MTSAAVTIAASAIHTQPVAGQTWRRKGYQFRNLVLEARDIEGVPYVLHRLECDEPGQLVRCDTLPDFLDNYEAPEWATPPTHERVEFAAAVIDNLGELYTMSSWPTIREAYLRAVELRGAAAVVAMQKITTTKTYEWVEYTDEVSS
jgi:hypothetical protein